MTRTLAALLTCACCACATTPDGAPPPVSEDIKVETITVELLPEGRGSVGFVLDVKGHDDERGKVVRVEWELQLQGHDFAAGVATASVDLDAARHTRLMLEEPVVFGNMAFDARPRTVPVSVRGTVITRWPYSPDEKKAFAYTTRVAVRGAPVWER